MDKFLLARQLFDRDDLNESLNMLNDCLADGYTDKQVFLLRGRIFFKQQKWGRAMNDFLSVLEIDPEDKEAKSGLEMTRNILGYFNPDLFNP